MTTEPSPAAASRGEVLLQLARRGIEQRFEDPSAGYDGAGAAPWLTEGGATYVTLRADGTMRGCMGYPLVLRPLGEDVWVNARTAAFQDLRFPPLDPKELAGISIEVSLLSPLETLGYRQPDEVLAMLRPGTDGLILQNELSRGAFLPYMWEELPTRERFLAGLRRKARLPEDFWGPEVRLWRFTVESWQEAPAPLGRP